MEPGEAEPEGGDTRASAALVWEEEVQRRLRMGTSTERMGTSTERMGKSTVGVGIRIAEVAARPGIEVVADIEAAGTGTEAAVVRMVRSEEDKTRRRIGVAVEAIEVNEAVVSAADSSHEPFPLSTRNRRGVASPCCLLAATDETMEVVASSRKRLRRGCTA